MLSPSYSSVDHEPSRMEQGMLVDMGWDVVGLSAPQGQAQTVGSFTTGVRRVNQTFGSISVQPPKLSISDVTVREHGTRNVTANFTVTLSTPSNVPVTVTYATANGTAVVNQDFTRATGTLTFAPGETSKTISVIVRKDAVRESNEHFLVRLTQPQNAVLERATGRGTIQDGTPAPASVQAATSPVVAATQTTALSVASQPSVAASRAAVNLGTSTTSQSQLGTSTATVSVATASNLKTSQLVLDDVWCSFDRIANSL